jgi:hypothetical protein
MRKGSRKDPPSTENGLNARYSGGLWAFPVTYRFDAPQCLRGRAPRSGSGRARALLAMSPRKSPRGAVSVISLPRTGSFRQSCGLACIFARSAKLPADDSACTVVATPSDESTMPHTSSDIGFMMKTPLRTGIGPLASFISYASVRKDAVNIGKELFPGFPDWTHQTVAVRMFERPRRQCAWRQCTPCAPFRSTKGERLPADF